MKEKLLNPDKLMSARYIAIGVFILTLDTFIPFVGILSLVLFYIALDRLIHDENNHFKLAKKNLKKMTVAYVIMRLSVFMQYASFIPDTAYVLISLTSMGLETIYFNYFSHYFTEGVLLDAKKAKVNYSKLGFNTPWIIFGVFLIAQFICRVFFVAPIPTIVGSIALFAALYYAFAVFQGVPLVYGDKKKTI